MGKFWPGNSGAHSSYQNKFSVNRCFGLLFGATLGGAVVCKIYVKNKVSADSNKPHKQDDDASKDNLAKPDEIDKINKLVEEDMQSKERRIKYEQSTDELSKIKSEFDQCLRKLKWSAVNIKGAILEKAIAYNKSITNDLESLKERALSHIKDNPTKNKNTFHHEELYYNKLKEMRCHDSGGDVSTEYSDYKNYITRKEKGFYRYTAHPSTSKRLKNLLAASNDDNQSLQESLEEAIQEMNRYYWLEFAGDYIKEYKNKFNKILSGQGNQQQKQEQAKKMHKKFKSDVEELKKLTKEQGKNVLGHQLSENAQYAEYVELISKKSGKEPDAFNLLDDKERQRKREQYQNTILLEQANFYTGARHEMYIGFMQGSTYKCALDFVNAAEQLQKLQQQQLQIGYEPVS